MERNKIIIGLYEKGERQSELARKFRVSRQRIQQIVQKSPLFAKRKRRGEYTTNYDRIHQWIRNNYSKSGVCEFCKEEKKTQFAVRADKKHAKKRENYLELCVRCHSKYDNSNSGQRKRITSPVFLFRLTPEDKKELEKAAAKSNMRVSEFIRQAIKEKAESIKI